MHSYSIGLNSVEDAKNFVSLVSAYDFDFDLTQGRYVIDVKSLLGVLSLDLSQPISLTVVANDTADYSKLEESIKDYLR